MNSSIVNTSSIGQKRMALREVQATDFQCFTAAQVTQRIRSLQFASKKVEIDVSNLKFDVEVSLSEDKIETEHECSRIVLGLVSSKGKRFTLLFELTELNRVLQALKMPQVIPGVSQDFLTSLMQLVVSTVLEALFQSGLTLNQVRLVNNIHEDQDSISIEKSLSFELAIQGVALMSFILVGRPAAALLKRNVNITTVLNVDIMGMLGIGYVGLAPEEFCLVEVGDILPLIPLVKSSCLFLGGDLKIQFGSEKEAKEVSAIPNENLVKKSANLSLHCFLSEDFDFTSFLSRSSYLIINSKEVSFRGRLLQVKGRHFFLTQKVYKH